MTTYPAATALRVLVVDDEPLVALQIEDALTDLEYEVVGPAHSAATAMALFRTASPAPDVVLLDINLGPRSVDGIALAGQLLAERPVPLIFLSSLADAASFKRARQVGPAAYLVKPVDPPALQRAIELAVGNFAASQELPALTQPDDEGSGPTAFATPGAGMVLPDALFVKEEGLLVKVSLQDIQWVEAVTGGCRLALSGARTVTVLQNLRDLATHLPAQRFVQIQRSYLINAACIERLDPARSIVQVCGQLLPMGRSYRDELLKRLHLV